MGIKEIQVTRRMTAIVEETYTLEFDEEDYNEYREKNPDKAYADICKELHGVRDDHIVSIIDTCAVHEEQYIPED